MTTTNTLPARPLACPSWCELTPEQHAPIWHADALRVDHQKVWRVEGAGVVAVGVEAAYVQEGVGLGLVLGPVAASVEGVERDVTAAGLRALAAALIEAAELIEQATEQATEQGRMDASAVSPTMACNGFHAFTLGRCARCGIVAPSCSAVTR